MIDFVIGLRTDSMFQEFINKASEITKEEYVYDTKRRRIRKRLPGETAEEEEITNRTGKEKLKIEVYFAGLDRLLTELQERSAAYLELFERFNFLITIQNDSMSSEDIILSLIHI